MEPLRRLIVASEDWLMYQVLRYAKEHNYVKYTSTLAEAWRISIASLSQTLLIATERYDDVPELDPDDDYTQDPIASFGITEAQLHRSRGLTLSMFLSLLKYYRQSYIDLICLADFSLNQQEHYRHFVNRCFDRIELGVCTSWSSSNERKRIQELQTTNRFLANEKNKYLTIFESLHDPVILLDSSNRIANMNHAAARLFTGPSVPGDSYYQQTAVQSFPWLAEGLARLNASGESNVSFEKVLETVAGSRHFHLKLERMLDVSEKFGGTVVLLNDLTERKRAAVMEERQRLARELHDSVTQLLYSLSLFSDWSLDLLDAGEGPAARERLVRIGEVAQQALKEMRLLLYELRSTALEQDGLVGALHKRLAAVEERAGVEARLLAEPLPYLAPAVEEGLYRIAQEALNNALKHAAASQVTVRICCDDRDLELEVSDNGAGFDPAGLQNQGGLGLHSMAERAAALGGRLEVHSMPGQGARVRVVLPAGPGLPEYKSTPANLMRVA